MGLTSGEILDVIDIVYYIPALLVAIFVAFRHGFRRSNGWLYLIPLGIIRIVGPILGILATRKHNKTDAEIAAILSSVGLSLLIQALTGLLRRLNEGVQKDHALNPKIIDAFTIPIIIGIGLGIDAGTQMRSVPLTYDSDEYSSGQDKLKVTGILFLIIVVAAAALTALAATKHQWLPSGELRIVLAIALCIPFLLVRVVYVLCIAFASGTSTTFNLLSPDVVVEGCMSTMPEFVSVAILLLAGLVSTKAKDVSKVGPAPAYGNGERHTNSKYQGYPPAQTQAPQAGWNVSGPAQAHTPKQYYQSV